MHDWARQAPVHGFLGALPCCLSRRYTGDSAPACWRGLKSPFFMRRDPMHDWARGRYLSRLACVLRGGCPIEWRGLPCPWCCRCPCLPRCVRQQSLPSVSFSKHSSTCLLSVVQSLPFLVWLEAVLPSERFSRHSLPLYFRRAAVLALATSAGAFCALPALVGSSPCT